MGSGPTPQSADLHKLPLLPSYFFASAQYPSSQSQASATQLLITSALLHTAAPCQLDGQ